MSLINVTGLTFGYEGSYDNVFENVSFQIDTDWKLGFIGRNGRGKTTFLKLLLGEYEYTGTISKQVEFAYFPFEVTDKTQLTLDVIEALVPTRLQWEIEKELSLLRVESDVLYRPFETLSNGEQTKVLLASLFLRENSFLLIDEPTNHLDIEARQVVGDYLNSKKGFILVSHDRSLLNHCIDHVLSINKANIEVQKGNYDTWHENRERQNSFEYAENEKLRKEAKKLEVAMRQTADWSDKVEKTKKGTRVAGLRPDRGAIGHKAAKMMKRSKVIETRREKALEETNVLLKNIEENEPLFLQPLVYPKKVLAILDNVQVAYENGAALSPVSFVVEKGDKILLQGKNGSGKSSILKLLAGENIPHSGTVQMGTGLHISYVPQDASFLQGSLKSFIEEHAIDEPLFKSVLRKFGFERVQFEKEMDEYSAGQKKKVLLAKSICEPAHLYVWDEPLNYIDLLSREQIEQAVIDSDATIVLVEHDAVFGQRFAQKKVIL